MSRRRLAVRTLTIVAFLTACTRFSLGAPLAGPGAVTPQELKERLTYISSDDLEGRAVFTTGIGLAAASVEDHLRAWGATPAGDAGSYLQTVRVLGVKATSHSTVTG